MNIEHSAMCYISMDPSRHALQTIGKLFFKYLNHFLIIVRKPKNIQTDSEV